MGIRGKIVAQTAAVWMAAAYSVCAAFTVLFPDLSLTLVGWMLHLVDVRTLGEVHVTVGGFIGGLAQSVIYAYVGAWFFVWLYKRFSARAASR